MTSLSNQTSVSYTLSPEGGVEFPLRCFSIDAAAACGSGCSDIHNYDISRLLPYTLPPPHAAPC